MTLRVRESSAAAEYELVLEPPPEPSRKPSVQWLAAFKKVRAALVSWLYLPLGVNSRNQVFAS